MTTIDGIGLDDEELEDDDDLDDDDPDEDDDDGGLDDEDTDEDDEEDDDDELETKAAAMKETKPKGKAPARAKAAPKPKKEPKPKAAKAAPRGKSEAIKTGSEKVLLLDPEEVVLRTDKEHPLYDPRAESKIEPAFVTNLKINGLIHPVTVRKFQDKGVNKWEVVAGRRRTLHLRQANKELKKSGSVLIPLKAIEVIGDDLQAIGIKVSENSWRKDDTFVAKARQAAQLLNMGMDVEGVANTLNVTGQTVRNYKAILGCDPAVIKAVEAGKIPASLAAVELAKLDKADQKAALASLLESGAVKGEAAVEGVRRIRNGKKPEKGGKKALRRRSKPETKKALRVLGKLDTRESRFVLAGIKYALGHDNAFTYEDKGMSTIDKALFPEEATA